MRGSRLGMMAALMGLAMSAGVPGDPSEPRTFKKYGGRFGPYMPHQSTRERARQVGGQVWADFKAYDRDRRGLPSMRANQGGN